MQVLLIFMHKITKPHPRIVSSNKFFIWVLDLLILIHVSFSCTFFNGTKGDTTLIGYNEDWSCTTTHVAFYPATDKKYGRAYFGCNNVDFSGVNDQGLFMGEAILTKREIDFPF